MDIINQAVAQLTELFRNMSTGSRVTAGLLLVVAVVSIGYLFQYQVTGGDEFLFNGDSIPSETLNRMQEVFGHAGLNSHFVDGGGRIKVPLSQRDKYLGALADAGVLPPHPFSYIEDSLKSMTIIEPNNQRQERVKLALERELSMIVGSMQGISSAVVRLDQQPQQGIGEAPLKTASVYVKPRDSSPLEREQGKKIGYLLVGAWAGLKLENVTVTDNNNGSWRFDPNDLSSDNLYQSATQDAERHLREKILRSLNKIPNVTVTPSVQLTTQKYLRTQEVKHDPKAAVPVHTVDENLTDNRESAAPGGPPGLSANQPRTVEATSDNTYKPLKQQKEGGKLITDSIVGLQQTDSETVGLVPKRESVSIGIPTSYYESLWRERHPAKPGEEIKKPEQAVFDADIKGIQSEIEASVKKTVANLLAPAEGVADPSELVTVTSYQEIKMPEISSPPITQTAAIWFDANWRTLAIGGLVVVSLLMLRTMIRSIPAPEPEVASARVSGDANEGKEEPVEASAVRKLRRMSGSGPSLRDELSDLVKEDPDSAANILALGLDR